MPSSVHVCFHSTSCPQAYSPVVSMRCGIPHPSRAFLSKTPVQPQSLTRACFRPGPALNLNSSESLISPMPPPDRLLLAGPGPPLVSPVLFEPGHTFLPLVLMCR